MIPVRYKNVPQAFLNFIDKFKRKIAGWYKSGSMGIGNSSVNVNEECRLLFYYLLVDNNLKDLMLADANSLPEIIEWMENVFPQLANDRKISPNDKTSPHSELYKCLRKAFCTLGYDDADFPNFEITEVLGIKACPYCNREEIQYNTVTDEDGAVHNIMDSELDHFFPKGRVPYLAVCLYNLVPSGRLCNGGNGKHEKDVYALKLVNPFSLQGTDGICFLLDFPRKGISSYDTFCDSCDIITLTPNPILNPNRVTFKIGGWYKTEKEQARKVWVQHKKVESESFRDILDSYKARIGSDLSFEGWMELELGIDPYDYNKKKLSKFSMDIWFQLERMRV